jgi:hypothetical protein
MCWEAFRHRRPNLRSETELHWHPHVPPWTRAAASPISEPAGATAPLFRLAPARLLPKLSSSNAPGSGAVFSSALQRL